MSRFKKRKPFKKPAFSEDKDQPVITIPLDPKKKKRSTKPIVRTDAAEKIRKNRVDIRKRRGGI